jgi:hypothetical protein
MGTIPITSGADPASMQVLATTSTQHLLWDYGNTENFFILTLGPPQLLQQVSPQAAYNFLGNTGVTVIYNPFLYNASLGPLSDQV